jgi:hypothetical protein
MRALSFAPPENCDLCSLLNKLLERVMIRSSVVTSVSFHHQRAC